MARSFLEVSPGNADVAGCFSGPALESAREGARFLIPEQPGDLRNAEFLPGQIARGKVVSKPLQNVRKAGVLFTQPARKGPWAHGKLLRDCFDIRLSVRQQRRDRVLNARPECVCAPAMRQRIFAVGEQQLVQVGVRAEDPRFRGVARERDIIDRRAELDSLAEEFRQLGPLIFASAGE